jgi:hypothetical protein
MGLYVLPADNIMKQQESEQSLSLTSFECINFLSVISVLCSVPLLYVMSLGPAIVVTPWVIFYWLKRGAPYFDGWTWPRVLFVALSSYVLGFALSSLCLYLLLREQTQILLGIVACILIGNLIYSALVFGRRIFRRAT